MTVTVNDLLVGPVVPAIGVTLISVDFFFEDETHLEVYKSGASAALTLGVDYTVTEPSAPGVADGSITLTTAANGTDTYSIYGKQPLQRSSDLQFRGDLRSPVLNEEYDRIWRAIQGIDTDLARVFRFSKTSDIPNDLETLDDASRVGKVVGFTVDGTGLALKNDNVAGVADIFRIMSQTLAADVTIAATENALAGGDITINSGVTLRVEGNLSVV